MLVTKGRFNMSSVWFLTLHSTCYLLCLCLLVRSDSLTPQQKALKELSEIQFNIKPENYLIYDTRTDEQDAVDSRLWGGINLKKQAGLIGEHLRTLANDELGVTTLQGVFDSIDYVGEPQDLQSQVTRIGEKLSSKLSGYRQVILSNKALVENLYKFHKRSIISQALSCCQLNDSYFSDALPVNDNGPGGYTMMTSLHTTCDLLPADISQQDFNPGRNLTTKFSQNIQRYPSLKWQYYMSTEGVQNEFPAHRMSAVGVQCDQAHSYRHREVFVGTMSPQPKNVVIVIDISSVLSPNQIKTAKSIAKQVLLSLSYSDKVTVLALSSAVEAPPTSCDPASLSTATEITKYYLSDYIDSLQPASSQANHSLGLQAAFSVIPTGEAAVVVYIARGLLNSLTEARHVLSTVADGNTVHSGQVVIHTYALMNDGQHVMYEEKFLQDLASQNFTEYGVTYTGANITAGTYHAVCCPEAAASAVNSLFVPTTTVSLNTDDIRISKPYNDLMDQGLVVSLSVSCVSDQTLLGVVGVDVTLDDITDQVTHTNTQDLYAFLIDEQGHVLMHPDIERTMSERTTLTLIHMTHYENMPGFLSIADMIMTTSNGTTELLVSNSSLDVASGMPSYSVTYLYSWYQVESTPYRVVMRALKSTNQDHKISSTLGSDGDGMVYHRLDLGQLPTDETCLHFQQLASFSTSALFLSARSFEKPYEHANQPETKKMVSNYLAYITDSSSYVSKPGLKDGVKYDAIAISRIDRHWLSQWRSSSYKQYIARRYIASPSGVYRMFPATLTRKLYDPTRSHWYKQAVRLPGRIMLTRPYIDSAGAGMIVTLSHSIYEGRSAALHTPRDPIAAVVGGDFSVSYLQKVLLDIMPTCENSGIRCFMVDDKGYIITHPNMKITGFKRGFEQQHITHLEPLVANDILGHKSLVSKKQCNSFTDRTVQRYYHFNTSLTTTLTNLKQGEQCVRYQMTLVPGTNLFLVIINETCEMRMSAFCPCSITDRLCLNCHRMEQSECECPCECPLTSDICTGDLEPEEVGQPSCDLFTESNILFKLPTALTQRIGQCVEPQCNKHDTQRSCMGVVGCSWCERGSDGSALSKGYCEIQQVCFGGVVGARTPYNDQIAVQTVADSHNTLLKNTPVGPVTGAILGAVLIIALGVYCYRHNVNRRAGIEQDLQDAGHCSGYNQESDNYRYHELPAVPGPSSAAAAHGNLVEMELPAHISPYHVNENYIPPRPVVTATESSDHGYSTMTAHEQDETETASSTSCIESLASSRSKHLPSIKILPPPPKANKNSRYKLNDSECKKLLPAGNSVKDSSSVLPQTIEEQPESETLQQQVINSL